MPDDTNHEKALNLARENLSESLLLPNAILFELLTVLNYELGLTESKRIFQEIKNNSKFMQTSLSESDIKDVLDVFFSQKHQLSAADSIVVYLAKKLNIGALTFDKGILNEIRK